MTRALLMVLGGTLFVQAWFLFKASEYMLSTTALLIGAVAFVIGVASPARPK
jgi:hypothetical protein